jgi:hypothetical protein
MATLQQRLHDARAEYHDLNTGRLARVVGDQNGERVEFVAANKTTLYNYIKDLESQLSPAAPLNNGPARFFF